MSKNPTVVFNDMTNSQKPDMKPKGLWYGCDSEWLDWVESEMPHWKQPYLYEIKIVPERMLMIKTPSQIDWLSQNYGAELHPGLRFSNSTYAIDWPKLASEYSGIEICPYQYSRRMNTMWYYGWDVASGCIWGKDAIASITAMSDK